MDKKDGACTYAEVVSGISKTQNTYTNTKTNVWGTALVLINYY